MRFTNVKYLFLWFTLALSSCTQLPNTPAIVMNVDTELASVIGFSIMLWDSNQPVGIDYGDGVIVGERIDGDHLMRRLKGETVIIYAEPNNIASLLVQSSSLLSLDVSGCKQLTYLQCTDNNLSTLDLSQNTQLRDLVCDFNDLTSLDLSGKGQLKSLNCSHNKLTSLNVTGCKNLESIFVEDNRLTSIELATCVSLERLYCSNNKLLNLDVSKNYRLKVASSENNPFHLEQ